ncbi:ATP binding [Balamuthia mandrillaris]
MAFQPPSKLKSTARRFFSEQHIRTSKHSYCCQQYCLSSISSEDFQEMRTYYWTLDSEQARTKFLVDCLFLSYGPYQETRAVRPPKQRLLLAGHLVCYKAIQLWLALSNKKFYACMDLWKTGATLPLHHNRGLVWHSTTYSQTKAWLTVYFANMGESLPNSEVIQIPMILNRKALYQEMVLSLGHDQSISYARFLQMLHEDFSYVHFSKQTRLGKCDQCAQLLVRFKQCKSVEALQGLQKERSDHLHFVFLHKEKYYKHRAKAKASPFKYNSIIMDYTEAIPLPHHHTPPKGWTIKKFIAHPNQTLYLQADNCYKENKNKYLLAFLCWLVHLKMFSKIKLCFLPPGHTHEDVDQMFSTFRKALLKFDIESLEQFFTFINSSYLTDETRPELHPLEWVWDFKGWLHPFMVNLEGHSQPLFFKFIYPTPTMTCPPIWPILQVKSNIHAPWSKPISLIKGFPNLSLYSTHIPHLIPKSCVEEECIRGTQSTFSTILLSSKLRLQALIYNLQHPSSPLDNPFFTLFQPMTALNRQHTPSFSASTSLTSAASSSSIEFSSQVTTSGCATCIPFHILANHIYAICPKDGSSEDFWLAFVHSTTPCKATVLWYTK